MQAVYPALQASEGFTITPSDSLYVFDDPGNKTGVYHVFVHNRSAGGDVRVMPAGQRVPPVITLTGTSGTANIRIKEVNYLVTFNTSLSQTAADFVTTHRDKLERVGIVVRNITGAELRFTGGISALAISNVSGDLSGTVATTATPITVYIPQGGTHPMPVSRIYATDPPPPTNLTAEFGGNH